jgi:hypothetical protein
MSTSRLARAAYLALLGMASAAPASGCSSTGIHTNALATPPHSLYDDLGATDTGAEFRALVARISQLHERRRLHR